MFKFASDFWGSKTTWTAITAIGTAITGAVTHQISLAAALAAVFTSLIAAFHRDTVAKGYGQAAADRAEMLDHAANATARAEVQAGLLPGWGVELGTVLDLFAKHLHSNTLNSVAGVIDALNRLEGAPAVAANPTPAATPTTATPATVAAEPVDGEADKVA